MTPRRRKRRVKAESEIVLLCNPRAGGRWKELARILDSDEAQHVRRIVTDSVEDVAAAVADLEGDTRLLCIYGGDGTIQRILDRMTEPELSGIKLALLGGGTMNVTSRWLGFAKKPAHNFRHVVRAYRNGTLTLREIPLMQVATSGEVYRCFTFGMGPIVRLLDAYERGRKGKIAAVGMAARALSAAIIKRPASTHELLQELVGRVTLDDESLPYDHFSAVFANVTGQINPGVVPFQGHRDRDSFHVAAYAVTARELGAALPMLIRGWLPVDVSELLLRPFDVSDGGHLLPHDARYVNRTASRLRVESNERMFTVDGEVLETDGNVSVSLGPTLQLATGPRFDELLRLAAESAVGR